MLYSSYELLKTLLDSVSQPNLLSTILEVDAGLPTLSVTVTVIVVSPKGKLKSAAVSIFPQTNADTSAVEECEKVAVLLAIPLPLSVSVTAVKVPSFVLFEGHSDTSLAVLQSEGQLNSNKYHSFF